jgi:predicted nucleic acid-binding protein
MDSFADASMSAVFVDASYWIAVRGRKEPRHERAVASLKEMASAKRAFVSTHFVFAEVHATFSRNYNLRQQVTFDFFHTAVFRVEFLEPDDYTEALTLLAKHRDKDYSYCDALSFVLMRRLGLKEALSFDGHFQQIGEFEILC